MIKGIPYFGENTQELYEDILSKENLDKKKFINKSYNSMYDFIISNIDKRIIVIINNKWLTWLNDIVFNYRDKLCYIPYFEYKTKQIDNTSFRTNNKGHLIINNKQLTLRYEYNYKKFHLNVNNFTLYCIDIDIMERFSVNIDKWIDETAIDLDRLYKLYIGCSFREDDFLVNKHLGGYHLISISPKEFSNKERKIREQYGLDDYSSEYRVDKDYRDVRQYEYEEVIKLNGLISNDELYRERRLRFESYLYCSARAGLLNNIKFNKHIYKLGDNIKLIIKDYWLDDINKPDKTYIK
jgi:hypothetical protein